MRTAVSALATALFTLFVPAIIAVAIPQMWIKPPGAVVASGIASRILATALIALGAVGYFWCATLFVKAQGTPAPAFPTQQTVVGGLYRVNRNPMYTSVLAVVFGQAVLYRDRALAIYGACLALGFHLFVILYEEPTLRARFDGEYEEFCRRVPRWLPGLRW